jgi:hypothetical protein
MKKILAISVALLTSMCTLSAQIATVHGKVVDQNGDPIPGAKVELSGWPKSVLSNLDGTFSYDVPLRAKQLQATYAGWQTTKKHINRKDNTVTLQMKKTTWWNEKPQQRQWFAGIQGTTASTDLHYNGGGVMFGRLKKWGWFVRGEYAPLPSTDLSIEDYYLDRNYWTTGRMKQGYWSGSVGAITRLWSPIHCYLGIGYGEYQEAREMANGLWVNDEVEHYESIIGNFGLMLKMKRLFINVGMTGNLASDGGAEYITAHAGIGLFF